jgi:hypothetical protein
MLHAGANVVQYISNLPNAVSFGITVDCLRIGWLQFVYWALSERCDSALKASSEQACLHFHRVACTFTLISQTKAHRFLGVYKQLQNNFMLSI